MPAFLKKELEDNGFIVDELVDNLLLVNNFISKDEVSEFLEIAIGADEETWKLEYFGNLKPFCLQKFGRDDVENLVAEGKLEITQNWEDKNLKIASHAIAQKVSQRLAKIINEASNGLELADLVTFQRMQDGVELKAHSDQSTDPSISYAAIIYLNEDYNGGEIFFSNKGLELKPKPGSLLIFPGSEEFNHGVRHVKSGPIRYVITGFIKQKHFYENNKY
jgi:hypothetical protein